jgi:hypothetical protein
MEEIKIGSVVYLNSCPEFKLTVVGYANTGLNLVGYDFRKNEFVNLFKIPQSALTLVNPS